MPPARLPGPGSQMDMHLHLLLLLLLCLSLQVDCELVLTCHQCHYINANGVCESGEGVCQTVGSQECILRKFYVDNKLLYGDQGCGDLCLSMSFFQPFVKVDVACCHEESYCNKF